MKVIDIDDKEREWKPKSSKRKISGLQTLALEVVRKVLSSTVICTEVPILIRAGKKLWLDIYLPKYNIAIECDGAQHEKRVSFWQSRQEFNQQKNNDQLKEEWCERNEIILIRFGYDETKNCWEQKLRNVLFQE